MNQQELDEYKVRMRELAAQPYLRPGATDLDLAYVNAICEAQDRVLLWELMEANPGKSVTLPLGNMGFVPDPEAQENKAGAASSGAVFKGTDSEDVVLSGTDSPSRALPNNPAASGHDGDSRSDK